MFAMDLLVVVVALLRIQQDLGFHPAALAWVLTAFGLAFGGLLLLGGKLGDMISQVLAFRAGLVVFVLASLLGGLAQTPDLRRSKRTANLGPWPPVKRVGGGEGKHSSQPSAAVHPPSAN